ncbi:MAG: hypothetical protein H6843_09185 [Rhodospirillaceae bacterium]|nr:hypothetical protein [Rhodospirillaceae bacterium]
MKPSFIRLWLNYPRKSRYPLKALFESIGWDAYVDNENYQNTCAIRMSIALQLSGVDVKSSAGMSALAGPIKGKKIEIRQDKLSDYLESIWGSPEIFTGTGTENEAKIGDRNGVISFFEIPGYVVGGGLGGHIDVIDGKGTTKTKAGTVVNLDSVCAGSCYWSAKSVWFWEL